MSHLLNIALILCWLKICLSNVNPPVFSWGNNLHNISFKSQNTLNDILLSCLNEGKHVVIFMENRLNARDFLRNENDKIIFINLYNYAQTLETLYWTSVPITIEDLFKMENVFNVSSLKFNINNIPPNVNVIVINFEDIDENKNEAFKKHDCEMDKIYNGLRVQNDLIAFYTGYSSDSIKYTRSLLQTADTASNSLLIDDKSLLLYVNSGKVKFKGPKDRVYNNITLSQQQLTVSDKIIQFTLEGPEVLFDFSIGYSLPYWSIDSIKVNKIKLNYDKIDIPLGFSYHCAKFVLWNHDKQIEAVFDDFQIEPFLNGTVKGSFSTSMDCVNFIDVPILMGLCLCILLLAILSVGFAFLIDIKTPEMFDDPNKKTITINVSE